MAPNLGPDGWLFKDLVQIRGARIGSGLLVGRGLVLTALHCIADKKNDWKLYQPLQICLLRDLGGLMGGPPEGYGLAFDLVWPNPIPDGSELPDIALLKIRGASPLPARKGRLRIASLRVLQTDCAVLGFPKDLASSGLIGRRGEVALSGHANFSNVSVPTVRFTSTHIRRGKDIQGWKGLSGGPIFANEALVGVVRGVHPSFEADRTVDAEPLYQLLRGRVGRSLFLHLRNVITFDCSGSAKPDEPTVDISRLPTTDAELFGRKLPLKKLDEALHGNVRILTVVAEGGVGKSALVNSWLSRLVSNRSYHRIFGWSFFSQGVERQTSAAEFVQVALAWLGKRSDIPRSEWERGVLLATLVQEQDAIIVLDGLETLQHPPGVMSGYVKDLAVEALLKTLAAGDSGFCVVTTRVSVASLKQWRKTTASEIVLSRLDDQAGVSVLRNLGVSGRVEELQEAVHAFRGHALALTLLGTYLNKAHGGDIRNWREIRLTKADSIQGGEARRVMISYAEWIGEGPKLSILMFVGLFDRPLSAELVHFGREHVVPRTYRGGADMSSVEWNVHVQELRDARLLAPKELSAPDELDAHPLIRLFFGDLLRERHTELWTEANRDVYRYLCDHTAEDADSLDSLSPLYQAIPHGCNANEHEHALNDTYNRRIKNISLRNFGATGADLSAVASFFEEPWSRVATQLSEQSKGFAYNMAGYLLRAAGRQADAISALREGLKIYTRQHSWREAAMDAANLAEAYVQNGNLDLAVAAATEALKYAKEVPKGKQAVVARQTDLANVLLHRGELGRAFKLFDEAEQMQREETDAPAFFLGLEGYQYCILLLDMGHFDEVRTRVAYMQNRIATDMRARDEALTDLLTGRLSFMENSFDLNKLPQVEIILSKALASLRVAGLQQYLVPALLLRSSLLLLQNKNEEAERDIEEAADVIDRGGLRLFSVDLELQRARLTLSRRNRPKTNLHLLKAGDLIEKMAYHRRDTDIRGLQLLLDSD